MIYNIILLKSLVKVDSYVIKKVRTNFYIMLCCRLVVHVSSRKYGNITANQKTLYLSYVHGLGLLKFQHLKGTAALK